MTREEYEKQYDAIDRDDNDDSGSISMYARRAHASNMRVNVCQDYISSLEADNERLTKALEKAAKRLGWHMTSSPNDILDWLMGDK